VNAQSENIEANRQSRKKISGERMQQIACSARRFCMEEKS